MRNQSIGSEWHKSLEVATVTGIVMRGGLWCVELLDSKDVWKAGDWKENIPGREEGRNESKRHRVLAVF